MRCAVPAASSLSPMVSRVAPVTWVRAMSRSSLTACACPTPWLPAPREDSPPRLVFVGQGSGWDALVERCRGVAGIDMIPAVSAEEADRWMARATATLASLRPGGYDYAYPTKILASLAQGTPVIYAGPGQAASDVAEGGLGAACGLDAASGTAAWVGAEGARAWVRAHRSVEASSRAAAAVVRSAL